MVAGITRQEIDGQPSILDDITDAVHGQAGSPFTPTVSRSPAPWCRSRHTSMKVIAIQARHRGSGLCPDRLTGRQGNRIALLDPRARFRRPAIGLGYRGKPGPLRTVVQDVAEAADTVPTDGPGDLPENAAIQGKERTLLGEAARAGRSASSGLLVGFLNTGALSAGRRNVRGIQVASGSGPAYRRHGHCRTSWFMPSSESRPDWGFLTEA